MFKIFGSIIIIIITKENSTNKHVENARRLTNDLMQNTQNNFGKEYKDSKKAFKWTYTWNHSKQNSKKLPN